MSSTVFRYITAVILILFAVGGRGLSHMPVGPVYMGEIGLAFAVIALGLDTRNWRIFNAPIVWLLLTYMACGALATAPYISEYGVNALRDAVLWGYGFYALAWAGVVMATPRLPLKLFRCWKKYAMAFVTVCAVSRMVTIFFTDSIPFWPSTDVLVVQTKGEELASHLIPYAAYVMSAGTGVLAWIPIALGLVVSITVRAVLVGFTVSMVAVIILTRKFGRLARLAVFAAALFALVTINPFKPQGTTRDISGDGVMTNIESIYSESGDAEADSNRDWRLAWWTSIVDYTFGGEYFFTGKGYGVNLAIDDGFQIGNDVTLRSPHNSHMTVLARSGVPGFALWLAFLIAWFTSIIKAFQSGRRNGEAEWSKFFLVLMAYGLAEVLMACFDVYLEGPVGGIWFWTIIGIGIGSVAVYHQRPPRSFTARAELTYDTGFALVGAPRR